MEQSSGWNTGPDTLNQALGCDFVFFWLINRHFPNGRPFCPSRSKAYPPRKHAGRVLCAIQSQKIVFCRICATGSPSTALCRALVQRWPTGGGMAGRWREPSHVGLQRSSLTAQETFDQRRIAGAPERRSISPRLCLACRMPTRLFTRPTEAPRFSEKLPL